MLIVGHRLIFLGFERKWWWLWDVAKENGGGNVRCWSSTCLAGTMRVTLSQVTMRTRAHYTWVSYACSQALSSSQPSCMCQHQLVLSSKLSKVSVQCRLNYRILTSIVQSGHLRTLRSCSWQSESKLNAPMVYVPVGASFSWWSAVASRFLQVLDMGTFASSLVLAIVGFAFPLQFAMDER